MKYFLEKFITNCDKGLLQIATAHFITNYDKGLLQIATGTLLQIATSFITNCDRYYKLRQYTVPLNRNYYFPPILLGITI